MKELIGKKIKQMYVNQDQSILKFIDSEDNSLYYFTEADCCSETWFADILFGWKFFNSEVESVETLEVPEWINHMASSDGRTRQEYDEVYGFKLKGGDTAAYCEIIFRNSSNGYYCGWCEYKNGDEDKWVIEKIEESAWEQITEDWRA